MISIGKRSFQPKIKYTKLNESIDNILNVLLYKYLTELPLIVQHHFLNGVPKNYGFEDVCNYHRMPGHLTKSCRDLIKIIQDFINQKVIRIDDTPKREESDVGLVHIDNSKLRIFIDPLLRSNQQPRGCIVMTST